MICPKRRDPNNRIMYFTRFQSTGLMIKHYSEGQLYRYAYTFLSSRFISALLVDDESVRTLHVTKNDSSRNNKKQGGSASGVYSWEDQLNRIIVNLIYYYKVQR